VSAIKWSANNIGGFSRKVRVVAACETFGPRFIQQLQNPLIGTDCSRTGSSQIRKQLDTVVSPESKLTNR
jgi:hypothetical protein